MTVRMEPKSQGRPTSKEVEEHCFAMLKMLGVKRKNGIGVFDLAEDFSGWIGLNCGKHPQYVRVNVSIGIHCVSLMKMLDSAFGTQYQSGRWPTITFPMGTVEPNFEPFVFDSYGTMDSVAKRLVDSFEHYGLPYARSMANLQGVVSRLMLGIGQFGGVPEKYAIGLYLGGESGRALDFLDEQIRTHDSVDFETYRDKLHLIRSYLATSPSITHGG